MGDPGDATAGGDFGGTATANEGEVGFNGPNGLGDGSGISFADMDLSQLPNMFSDSPFSNLSAENLSGFDFGDITGQAPGFDMSTPTDEGLSGKFGKNFLGFLANQALGKTAQALGIPGTVFSGVLGMGKSAATGDPSHAAQGFFNAMANMATLGGYGAVNAASNALGFGNISGGENNTSAPANASGAGGFMDILSGLGGMYMGNRSAGQYNGAINSINDLFSPTSPYAQYMRQQLERKDAAAGRRSQYGPREAQLAGMLAQAQAQALTSPGYGNLMQQRNVMQNQGLNTILNLLSKTGIGNKIGSSLGDWMSQLFGNQSGGMGGFDMGPPVTMGGMGDIPNTITNTNDWFDLGGGG